MGGDEVTKEIDALIARSILGSGWVEIAPGWYLPPRRFTRRKARLARIRGNAWRRKTKRFERGLFRALATAHVVKSWSGRFSIDVAAKGGA